MTGRTARTAALVLLVIVVAAATAVTGYLVTRHVRTAAAAPRPTAGTPSPYAAADARPTSAPTSTPPAVDPAAVRTALASALTNTDLGTSLRASVLNAASGAVLLDREAATPTAPASVTKIATSVAVLSVRKATDRIVTTAVTDGRGTVALVGGGDPTLSAAATGQAARYPGAARLTDLVTQVRRAGVPISKIVVAGRFSGPVVSPYWAAEDVPSEYGAGITALMTDGGRAAGDDETRSATPDLAAGQSFARLLGRPDVPVTRGTSPVGARTIGTVRSAPIATLVEQALMQSDNVIADCLARQVALATGRPASFSGAAAAMRSVLREKTGVDIGAGLVDGSGLAARDRLSPATLTALLRAVVRSANSGVRSIVTSLPVAGWSGSLAARYVSGSSAAAAGVVRAKTGTLTGVSTLAGIAHTRRGGLVVFALFADRNTSTPAAQAGLDNIVSRLARCAC